MNLYLLTTKLKDFYVLAASPNDAQDKLVGLLKAAEYGFSDDQRVTNIKLVAEEISEFPRGKAHFSSGNTLILPTTVSGNGINTLPLKFLYDRLVKVYNENEDFDYMINFKDIIDKLK